MCIQKSAVVSSRKVAGETAGPVAAGSDPGASSSSSGAPPNAAASCARDVVARPAPASLYDAFTAELPHLAGAALQARVGKLLADVARPAFRRWSRVFFRR